MRVVELDSGCYIQLTHRLNQDGYFRKHWGSHRNPDHLLEMFHRTIWKHHHGAIPEGHEIDHMCGNRACFNINHLRCITRAEHLDHTNRNRYAPRKAEALAHWLQTKCVGAALAAKFGVSITAGYKWVREFKTH